MKKILTIGAFIITPFVSVSAQAGDCQHGGYAQTETHSDELIIAKETDSELLELLKKQREQEKLESQIAVYN